MLNEIFTRAYAAMLSLARDEEGASAVEYGLILGLIAVVIIVTLSLIGTDLNTMFETVQTCLSSGVC